VLRRERCRAHHDLGAVGLQDVALILTDLVGTDEDALVATTLGDQGKPDPRVARGGFHDGATCLELTAGLGSIDHPNGDAVLDRTTGVDVLHLCQDGTGHDLPAVRVLDHIISLTRGVFPTRSAIFSAYFTGL